MSTIVDQEIAVDRGSGSERRGYICGILDSELGLLDAAGGAEVYAVSPRREADSGPRRLTEDEFRQTVERDGVMKAVADECGAFRFDGESVRDGDGLFDLYAVIHRVPMPTHAIEEMPLPTPEYLFVGRQQPSWPDSGPALVLTIPQPLWCHLKRLADAWTVTGTVTSSADDQGGIPGAVVSVFDADGAQHDSLGRAVTSSTGTYRIDYPGWTYRPGTWADVEPTGGADLYFTVAEPAGNVLLEESEDKGRSEGRANSTVSAHVDLCVDLPVTEAARPGVGTAWRRRSPRSSVASWSGRFPRLGQAGPFHR